MMTVFRLFGNFKRFFSFFTPNMEGEKSSSSSMSLEMSVISSRVNNSWFRSSSNSYLYSTDDDDKNKTTGCLHYTDNEQPVILPHVTVFSPEEDVNANREDHQPLKRQIISSQQTLTPNDFKDGLMSEFSKTHADFEVPPFLVDYLQQLGFQLGTSIGSGTYGKVYLATFNDTDDNEEDEEKSKGSFTWQQKNHSYAIKVMDTRRLSMQYRKKFLFRELRALRSLPAHENVVRTYELFTVTEVANNNNVQSRMITMIMEHCSNGDVYEFIDKRKRAIPEHLAQRWFAQLLAAIEHLHGHGCAHRDIKCENLLLDEGYNLKLCDFGFCQDLTICPRCTEEHLGVNSDKSGNEGLVKRSETFCGSQNYCSPELLQASAYNVILNDVWACGVILYVMLFKAFPISPEQLDEMETFKFSCITYHDTEPLPLSADCLSILQAIFQPEHSRCTIAQLKSMPWIASVDSSIPVVSLF